MASSTPPVSGLVVIEEGQRAPGHRLERHGFAQGDTDLEVQKATIRAQLEKLTRLNKTRADFAELIENYNAGSRNIQELFEELLKLSRNLSEEQQRLVRERGV